MNKNLKVISSLAMAGILAATGLSSVSNAATTKSLGVYRKLVDGKIVVPYELGSSNDTLTAKNVKDDNGNITISLSDGSTVKTGTKFRKSGEEHTVIIYGDVEADGSVNVNDVTATAKAVFKTPTDKFVKEAADVEHDGSINVNDVTKLAKFIVKKQPLNVKLTPEKQDENEYTLAVNENNVVNNVNGAEEASTLVITPKSGSFTGEESFTVAVYKQEADGSYATTETDINAIANITPNANEKYVEVSEVSFGKGTGDAYTRIADGTYKLQILANSEVVAETEFEVNTDVSKMSANVVVKRMTNDTASLTFDIPTDAKIAEVYCVLGNESNSDVVVEEENIATVPNTVVRITGANPEATQTVTYVLVNEYGNRTLNTVVIPKFGATDAKIEITNIVANEDNVFQLTLDKKTGAAANQKIVATLYKDGKAIFTDDTKTTGAADSTTPVAVDLSEKIAEVGTYTLKAYIAATANENQSKVVDSATQPEGTADEHKDDGKIVITKLASVQANSITFNEETNKLAWTDNTNKNATYTITVKEAKADDKGKFEKYVTSTTIFAKQDVNGAKTASLVDVDDDSIKLVDDKCYKFEIVAEDKDASKRVLDSDAVESSEIYTLSTPTFTPSVANSTTVKLENVSPLEILGKEDAKVTYEVEIYQVEGESSTQIKPNRTVGLTKLEDDTYEIVLDKLTAGATYKFVLVAKVEGKETKSTTATVNMTKAETSVDGLVVDKNATAPARGKITIKEDGKAYIDGEEVENIGVYSEKYQAILTGIVAPLADGDKIVSVSDSKVVLQLNADEIEELPLGASVEGKEVEITGNGYTRTISTTNTKEPSKVTLNGGSFAINNTLAEEVVLNSAEVFSGVDITYTLKARSTNTIDRVSVNTTGSDAVVTRGTNAGELTVKAGSSALTFDSEANLAVTVTGEGANTQTHSGKITIVNKGNVDLVTENAVVEGAVDVKITNGTLRGLDNINFTGEQKVTVTNKDNASNGTVITAKLASPAPFINATTGEGNAKTVTPIVAKQYATELEEITGVDEDSITEGKKISDVISFINGLGLKEADNATIEITDKNVIKITIKGNITDYVVPGLQK